MEPLLVLDPLLEMVLPLMHSLMLLASVLIQPRLMPLLLVLRHSIDAGDGIRSPMNGSRSPPGSVSGLGDGAYSASMGYAG